MEKAIMLAVAASLCTATSSVCQRKGARSNQTAGFDVRLLGRLARRPVWLLGIASMILGFVFQLTALRFGGLALVQPILAAELLFVFGYLAIAGSRQVTRRDWLAAAAMSAGVGMFLRLASPSGGRLHAAGSSWLLAGLVTAGVVLVGLAVTFGPGRRTGASQSRRAAMLGSVTGISWGFTAAVIKELSSHLGGGPGAIFSTWSPYVLIAAGAATMLLASHALAAGPLAASQPGFTILDPLAASLLGVYLFDEHIRTGAADLAGEALALALLIAGASAFSRSSLIVGENGHLSCEHKPALSSSANSLSAIRPLAHPKDPSDIGSCGTGRSRALNPDVAVLTDGTLPGPARPQRPGSDHPGSFGKIKILIPNGPWPSHNARL
ncbi:MAG TPA: DMT family transporter [Streptosporangiaceae bacterium]